MAFIQEGKELRLESHDENKAGERVEIQMNDLKTQAETVPIQRPTTDQEEREELTGDAQESDYKPCVVEKTPPEDNEMLEGSLHELDGVCLAEKGVFYTSENWRNIDNLAEVRDELGECRSHCAIYRKSRRKKCSATNVAGVQAETEELDQNGEAATSKQDVFPEYEVRRVLNYFDKESSCLENEYSCSKEDVVPCRAYSEEVNMNDTQESEALDKLAQICPEQEVFEMKSVESIKNKEIEFLKTLSAKPNNLQVTDMALFLHTFDKVMNPNLQRKLTDISPKGLNWLTCSSPANQDKMPDLHSENAQLRRRVQDLGSELCEAIFRQNLAESAYEQSMLQMDDLLNKLDDSSDRINELEACYGINVEDFDSQLQHTERQVMELRVSLLKSEEENGDLERKLLETQKHVQRLGVQLQIGSKQRQQLIYEVEEEQELSSALKQEIISQQRTILSFRKTLDLYKHEVSSKETVEEESKASNSELKRRNEELEEEVSAIQNELRQSERERLELQEHLWQTHRILSEVQSDYKVVYGEKDTISEELKAFYERHNELKMSYRLCVNEKNEKEQEIAVLLAKVEDSLSEAANCSCFPHLPDLETDRGSRLKKCDENNREQTPNLCERTMIEGEDIHPLSESGAGAIKISLACVPSPYLKDDTNTVVYFYNISENILQKTSATDPMETTASHEENLHCLGRDDMYTVVGKEQLQEIQSMFNQCEERQSSLEKDLENNKVTISLLQDRLTNSQQERLDAYDKLSQLQVKHEDIKSAFEMCNQEKSNLLKRASVLTRKFRDLQEKYESQRTQKCSLQQQLRIEEKKSHGGRSEILRINQQCMEQKLLLDASEFGMNFF